MLCQNNLQSQDSSCGILAEEKFLRYRLQVVQKMADGPFKAAIVTAIISRSKVLQQRLSERPLR
jgi:hypothetical protein